MQEGKAIACGTASDPAKSVPLTAAKQQQQHKPRANRAVRGTLRSAVRNVE